MKIGIAADHGGYDLKISIHTYLTWKGYELIDYGAYEMNLRTIIPTSLSHLEKRL